ncbi:disulfide bond formation protein DsbB [Paraferrimonas sedimenticola]|uniref:Disulfide bond formation protein B n=1 Tax=Paraferrimonas sedimenticola TaxID=375674 RepID=A0AA37RZT7_9GAMM|nr:disulfide bond formation protein DsbB [Paraferrimonas sedimenticola]GLP97983.1 disulfide bond formation protein B [Paraferrimonas sedimenticola]
MGLHQFAQSRLAWGLLLGFALLFEGTALTIQYALAYEPCINCVYQRTALLGIALAGFLGIIAPQKWPVRAIGWLVWAIAAIWGLLIAHELVELQNNPSPFHVCSFSPEFWVPLDQWFPWLLQPTGSCTDEHWVFLGQTMAEWTRVMFAGFSLAALVFAIPSLRPNKTVN